MKSFGRLFAISCRFYLCVVALVTVLVLVDCVYICNDRDVLLTRTGVEQYVEHTISEEDGISELENYYVDLAGAIMDKGGNASVMGLWLTIVGIIIVLLVREVSFSEDRTLEFRTTWPVKSWVREVYHYLAMLVVIVFGGVLEMGILWIAQLRHYDLMSEVLDKQGILSKSMELISQNNQRFITGMACYILCIVVTYTWIHLGMSLARNIVAGAVLALIMKGGLALLCDTVVWEVVSNVTMHITAGDEGMANGMAYYVTDIGMNVLSNSEFFFNMDINQTIDGGVYVFTVTHWMIVQVVICLLLVIGIVISAKKKDLAKGRLFYFPMLDYPFAVIAGLILSVFFVDFFWWCLPELGFIIAMILAVIIFALIHPFSKSKTQCLEVK